jgi:1-deoxy-D-xylulose-5-phosphate synthase
VAVIEDNVAGSGVAAAVSYAVAAASGPAVPVWSFGVRQEFQDHGSRGQVLERVGLTADSIATSLVSRYRGHATDSA